MVAQQKASNKKNSKAKKAANKKVKRKQALENKDEAEKERCATSISDQRPKKPAAAGDEVLNVCAPSLDVNGQAVDETLTPISIYYKPKPAKVNGEIANNQATKDPVMSTFFSTCLSKHSTQRISIPTLTKQKTPRILTTKTGKA